MLYIEVAVTTPVHTTFTYRAPEDPRLTPGTRVAVPFRKRKMIGICTDISDRSPDGLDAGRIKDIDGIIDDEPSFNPSLLRLIKWMSSYYCAPIGEVCRAALPTRMMRLDVPKTTRPTPPPEIQSLPEGKIVLNEHQKNALKTIASNIDAGNSKTFLLHGVTGSGKTEVYLRLFSKLAKEGKQGLLLVPEIGLTPQLTGRTTARFGDRVAVYHSGLTDAQRHEQWMRIRRGEVDVVIGTRSALFAPLQNLGAIVVDEEHDGSYKQDDGFTYHGRDSAIMRAHIESITTILGSATPSLESFANVEKGKYANLTLPLRTKNASLPNIEIVDLRKIRRSKSESSERAKRHRELESLSPKLYDAIDDALNSGDKILLYIGKRGFASFVQCTACGEVAGCPNCDIALTAHGNNRSRNEQLVCHYCDYKIRIPETCPSCGGTEILPLGQGTERLEAEIEDFFPKARVARLDSDVTANPTKRRKIFEEMRTGKIDILIGTQMITKGHDFPEITLVGVVSADLSLAIPDFRSAERTFQLITQVAGRAGRGDRPGRVIIQTRQPTHYSIEAASRYDCDSFTARELRYRSEMNYPPFSRLANIRLSSTKRELASEIASKIMKIMRESRKIAPDGDKITLLGPAPATIEKLRGRYRWQILIKSPSSNVLSKFLAHIRPQIHQIVPAKVRLSIDVDPTNMM